MTVPRMVASTTPITATLERVDDADQQGIAIRADRRIIGDGVLADRDARGTREKGQAGRDMPRRQVGVHVVHEVGHGCHQGAHDHDLPREIAETWGSDQDMLHSRFGGRRASAAGVGRRRHRTWRCNPSACAALSGAWLSYLGSIPLRNIDARGVPNDLAPTASLALSRSARERARLRAVSGSGGAYCSPPLFHKALMPRGTPKTVMLRSQTSPKLPTCLIALYDHLLSIPSRLAHVAPRCPSAA